uniref:Uncharacterized protein n=1 Tax=Lygus hesperus TaxID=30085 RepID=A0A146L422_LYGHE
MWNPSGHCARTIIIFHLHHGLPSVFHNYDPVPPTLVIGVPIRDTSDILNLGVRFSSKLMHDVHANHILSLHSLRCLKFVTPPDLKRQKVVSLILLFSLYCPVNIVQLFT